MAHSILESQFSEVTLVMLVNDARLSTLNGGGNRLVENHTDQPRWHWFNGDVSIVQPNCTLLV
jgi:hypothetical protein